MRGQARAAAFVSFQRQQILQSLVDVVHTLTGSARASPREPRPPRVLSFRQ
jgi:hypothetical protein